MRPHALVVLALAAVLIGCDTFPPDGSVEGDLGALRGFDGHIERLTVVRDAEVDALFGAELEARDHEGRAFHIALSFAFNEGATSSGFSTLGVCVRHEEGAPLVRHVERVDMWDELVPGGFRLRFVVRSGGDEMRGAFVVRVDEVPLGVLDTRLSFRCDRPEV